MYIEKKTVTDFSQKVIKKNLKRNNVLQNFENALKDAVEQLYFIFTEHEKLNSLCELVADTNIEKVVFPGTCDEVNNYWQYPYVVVDGGKRNDWQAIQYMNKIKDFHTTAPAEKEIIDLIGEINQMLRDAPIFSSAAFITVTGYSVIADLGVYRSSNAYNPEALAFLASMVNTGFEKEEKED